MDDGVVVGGRAKQKSFGLRDADLKKSVVHYRQHEHHSIYTSTVAAIVGCAA